MLATPLIIATIVYPGENVSSIGPDIFLDYAEENQQQGQIQEIEQNEEKRPDGGKRKTRRYRKRKHKKA